MEITNLVCEFFVIGWNDVSNRLQLLKRDGGNPKLRLTAKGNLENTLSTLPFFGEHSRFYEMLAYDQDKYSVVVPYLVLTNEKDFAYEDFQFVDIEDDIDQVLPQSCVDLLADFVDDGRLLFLLGEKFSLRKAMLISEKARPEKTYLHQTNYYNIVGHNFLERTQDKIKYHDSVRVEIAYQLRGECHEIK